METGVVSLPAVGGDCLCNMVFSQCVLQQGDKSVKEFLVNFFFT